MNYSCVAGNCVVDPKGIYASLAACQAACIVTPTRYSCVAGVCTADPNGIYSSLAVCQAACENVSVPGCCPNNTVPAVPHVSLQSISPAGNCNCALTMASVPIVYNPATGNWTGSGPFGTCGPTLNFSMDCANNNSFELTVTTNNNGCTWTVGQQGAIPFQCAPIFQATFPCSGPGPFCGCTGIGFNVNFVVTP